MQNSCVATSQCSHIDHLRRNHAKLTVNIEGAGVTVPKSGAIFNYGFTCNNNIICNPIHISTSVYGLHILLLLHDIILSLLV